MYTGGKIQSVINYIENKKSRKRIERMVTKSKLRIGNCANKKEKFEHKKEGKWKEGKRKRMYNKERKKKSHEIVWEVREGQKNREKALGKVKEKKAKIKEQVWKV